MAMLLEKLEHPGAVREKRLCVGAVEMRSSLLFEVPERFFPAVLDAATPCMGVERNPRHARRVGRGTAEIGLLLDYQHLQTMIRGGERGAQSACSGARDQYVAFEMFHVFA